MIKNLDTYKYIFQHKLISTESAGFELVFYLLVCLISKIAIEYVAHDGILGCSKVHTL